MTHCLNTNLNTNIFQNEKKNDAASLRIFKEVIKGQGLAVFLCLWFYMEWWDKKLDQTRE